MPTLMDEISSRIKSQYGNLLALLKVDDTHFGSRQANLYDLLNSPLVGSQKAAQDVPLVSPGCPNEHWLKRVDALAAVGQVPKFQNDNPSLTTLIQELAMLAKELHQKGTRGDYDRQVWPLTEKLPKGPDDPERKKPGESRGERRRIPKGETKRYINPEECSRLLASVGAYYLCLLACPLLISMYAFTNSNPEAAESDATTVFFLCYIGVSLGGLVWSSRLLKRDLTIWLILGLCIPCVNLGLLLHACWKLRDLLKSHGVRVGLLGPTIRNVRDVFDGG